MLRILVFLAMFFWSGLAFAAACSLTTISAGPPKVLACTDTTATTITVPADWNSGNNKVEVIGAGETGDVGSGAAPGAGGNGGGYARNTNVSLTPGASTNIQVGATTAFNPGTGAGDTWFITGGTLLGRGGRSSTASNVGSTTFAGGNGGAPASFPTAGSGGGGAAGSTGAGGGGGNPEFTNSNGGGGGSPSGGAGGTTSVNGSNGTFWSASYGSGGGGGGADHNVLSSDGGNGGNYGGGGGGANYAGSVSGSFPGVGGNGVIVLTYTPATVNFIPLPGGFF